MAQSIASSLVYDRADLARMMSDNRQQRALPAEDSTPGESDADSSNVSDVDGSPLGRFAAASGTAMHAARRRNTMIRSAMEELTGAGSGRSARGRGNPPPQRQQRRVEREDRVYPPQAQQQDDVDAPGAETESWRDSPEYERFLRELGPGAGPDKCFACLRVKDWKRVAPVCELGLNKISEMARTCTAADRLSLSRDLAELFDVYVRQEANRCKKPDELECPEWRAADIYEHFFTQEHKRLDALSSLEQRILYYEEALSRMNRHYVYMDIRDERGTALRVPEPRRLKESMSVSMYLDKLYSIKPSNMALASSDGPILRRTDAIMKRPTYSILPYIGVNGRAPSGIRQ